MFHVEHLSKGRVFWLWQRQEIYDSIVIGAGHAGIEAALAVARSGHKGYGSYDEHIDTIGQMSCNPAIGGIAKGHLVKEIDALGGEMARAIDETGIQFRTINASKGRLSGRRGRRPIRLEYKDRMKRVLPGHRESCILKRRLSRS